MTEGRGSANPFDAGNALRASYLCVFLYSSGEAALHVLVPPYLSDGLGYGPAVIGALSAVFALSSLVLRLPVGAAYTRRRVRPLLLVGGVLSAGAFAVVPLVRGPVGFGALMALDGVGWALATTTQLAVLVASRPSNLTVASAMGWYSGFTGLGHTVGSFTAGAMADGFGYATSFVALAAFPAIATAVMLRALPSQLAAAVDEHHDAEPGPAGGSGPRGFVASLRAVRTLPVAIYSGVLIMFFINYQSALFNTFHPVLALAAGLSLTQIGALTSCRSLASSVTRLSSGPLFARSTGARLTTPLLVLGAATLWVLPLVRESFWLQAPLFLAAGLSRGLLRVTGAAQSFTDGGESEQGQGLVAALLHMGLDLGKVAGPPIGGLVAQLVGVPAMFQVSAVALLAAYAAVRVTAARRRPVPALSGRR